MEENTKFTIPLTNFKRLIEQDISDQFKIIIEYGQKQSEILTTNNIARLISRKINDIYLIDPTINEYHIIYNKLLIDTIKKRENETKNNEEKEEIEEIKEMINSLLKSTKQEITIQPKSQIKFNILLYLLGEKRNEKNRFNIETQDEAISLLSTDLHDSAIEYLSRHLIELIDSDQMKNINYEILKEIIDNYFEAKRKNNYEQTNEDINEIFQKLKKIGDNQITMHFLLSYNYEEFNEEMINYFYENFDDEIIENEYSRIIFIIKHHLCSLISKCSETKKYIECKYIGNKLNGIFNHLRQKLGDSLYNNEIIKLSAGGSLHKSYPVSNLIKYDKENIENSFFNYEGPVSNYPISESDSWIDFDFGERKINLTSYAILSCSHTIDNGCKAKSWRIIGSNDHDHWDVLNHQLNRSELKDPNSQHIFECEKSSQYYRYIRYIQEETWNTNNAYKYLIHYKCIEFFGSILEP